jgi:hypothetical protein
MAINKALLDKLKKNSTIEETSILANSKFFNERERIDTGIPIMNLALSGSFDGGSTSGLTVWAGPSKHFKTAFVLLMAKTYMDKHPDSILLYYDSEFGTPKAYFKTFGIDMNRVLHVPVTDIEQLKHDFVKQLREIKRGDKVITILDSAGNIASKKEVDDALEGKSVADMSRAKQLKSFFRMITPHLNIKDLQFHVVNHTYKEIALYPKDIVSGGTGITYSADTIFIVGKQQEKDGTELLGWNFVLNCDKSRFVKEKSKFPIRVTFDGGISKWSGLLEIAQESKHVVKPSNGWYSRVIKGVQEERKFREKDTDTEEFWKPVLEEESFIEYVKETFRLGEIDMLQSTVIDDIEDLDEDAED